MIYYEIYVLCMICKGEVVVPKGPFRPLFIIVELYLHYAMDTTDIFDATDQSYPTDISLLTDRCYLSHSTHASHATDRSRATYATDATNAIDSFLIKQQPTPNGQGPVGSHNVPN